MAILVTGATGFVGYAAVHRLLGAGHDVIATSRSAEAQWPGGAVKLVHGDLRDREFARQLVRDADAVVHLAALTRVRESFDQPEDYAAVNVTGTENLLAAIEEGGRSCPFVNLSTAVVYGTPERQPISEDFATAPSNPYGVTKLAGEQAVRRAAEAGVVAGVSLRGFNICGAVENRADSDLSRIVPKAVAVAAGRFPELAVNGDGRAIRDFVHVADVAEAVVLALGHAAPGRFDVYNVGATPATVAGIVAVVEQVAGVRLPVRHNPPAPEAPELRADTSRIRRELGWRPRFSSLERIVGDAWAAERR
ncbi:UDP-glucose 4-epimerase GalE [Catenulispora yoronensis]|uniref:UDP-glucose 4-epimerase n=1 Tax=Catenulispora yoronensis TaxID=450799 RepID=A0ABN2UJ53_9ACTN